MFSKPKGTRDILPDEMEERRAAEKIIRECFESFGYREVQTPIFEHSELITEKSGEDIVEHLYAFEDKSRRRLALRPELSAPTIRLYANELITKPKPARLYYIENCFRYENPQSGRYREFWQAGIELIGTASPLAEAEVIYLAFSTLKKLGLKNFELSIGNVGIVRNYLKLLSLADEKIKAILHILDKKELGKLGTIGIEQGAKEKIIELANIKGKREEAIKKITQLISNIAKAKAGKNGIFEEIRPFEETLKLAEMLGVDDYVVDFGVVRGLDYYSGTVFEIYSRALDAQKQICGGGSYSLVKLIGNRDEPSCGFAFGFDRVMLALEREGKRFNNKKIPFILVIPRKKEVLHKAIEAAAKIRKQVSCELELSGKTLEKALKYANARKIPYTVIVDEKEIVIRNMATGEQKSKDVSKAEEVLDGIER